MKLSAVMKDQYSASKLAWAGLLLLQSWAFIAALVSINRASWAAVALLSGALVPIFSAGLKRLGQVSYERGERLRRLLVMSEGLGRALSLADLAEAAAVAPALRSLDPEPLGAYYASKKTPGAARLADIVAESAMFSARLARTSEGVCFFAVLSGVTVGVAMLLIFVGRPWSGPIDAEKVAQAASMVLAFGFTTEFIGLMFSYRDLKTGALRALAACSRLADDPGASLDEVRLAVEDYDLTLAKSPPLAGIPYRLQRRFLDETWKDFTSVGPIRAGSLSTDEVGRPEPEPGTDPHTRQ